MRRRVGLGLAALALALAGSACVVAALGAVDAALLVVWQVAAFVVPFAVSAAAVIHHRPAHPVGWLLLGVGFTAAVSMVAAEYANMALEDRVSRLPLGPESIWVADLTWFTPLLLLPFALMLFPDGSLPSRRWRPAVIAAACGLAMTVGALGIGTWPDRGSSFAGEGLIRWTTIVAPMAVLGAVLSLSLYPASLVALHSRWRRSDGVERLQLRWMAWAGLLATLGVVVLMVPVVPDPLARVGAVVGVGAVPAAIAVAILRYRLWDLDSLIKRSVVYTVLSGLLTLLYLASLALITSVLGGASSVAQIPVVIGIALLAQPLRTRTQSLVDSHLYGERHDPYRVLTRVSEQLQAPATSARLLPEVVAVIAHSMAFGYVAIHLHGPHPGVVAFGSPRGDEERLPLVLQDERVGELHVGARPVNDPLTGRDRELLTALARQAAIAARTVMLTQELQESRLQLVTAREEERRRLRRELHDGLGPTLAAVAAGLEAIERDPTGSRIVSRLREATQSAVSEVRSMARDLRPPTLDALGLRGAVSHRARELGLQATLRYDVACPVLPAALEVAAYRIAAEALLNVARHAGDPRCDVLIVTTGDELVVEVRDAGSGLAPVPTAGVGLLAMHERAAELGGRCIVESSGDGGTLVRASLPYRGAES